MTNISGNSLGGQFGQDVSSQRALTLSSLLGSDEVSSTANSALVAQTSDAGTQSDPNVIRMNRVFPDTWAVGRAIPGIGLNGAATDAAGYVLWSNQNTPTLSDDKLTAFGSLPLPPRLATAAGLVPVLGAVLTQLGIADSASAADALAGTLFTKYQSLDRLLNSPAFKQALPAGATVIPSIVASTPVQGITSVLDNGKTEIGLGLTIVLPTGAGKDATKTAFFINSRQNLDQLIRGENPDRSINFGGLLLNAEIPRTGQKVNIGPAWRTTLSASGTGPWEVQFPDNTSFELPAPLAMAANSLFERNAPLSNAGFGELSELVERVPPEVLEQVGSVVNGGLYVADTAASISSIAAAFKAVGLTGPTGLILGGAWVLGGQFLEKYDEFVQENATLSFQKGEFTPSLALPDGLHRGAYYGNNNIDILKATIEMAIANGASVEALRTQWEDVLDGNLNGGLTGTDLLEARFAAANLLGRGEEAVQLYRQLEAELGPPGVGVLVGDPAFIASAARNYAIDELVRPGQTEVVDSNRVVGEPRSIGWVGTTVGQGGVGLQGMLMTAQDRTGQDVYWLQGPTDNYWLRDASGSLIANQDEATARARELISNGAATKLYPLQPEYVSPDNGSVATTDNTRSIDGVAIVEPTVLVEYVGVEVGNTGVGLQGALTWAYTPSGERVFWLQGPTDNYLLRNGQGDLIRGQGEAQQRALELIRSGSATRLYSLDISSGSVGNDGNRGTQIDGVTIQGTPSTVQYVGVESVGLQGLLMWGREPGGQVVFWLQGAEQSPGGSRFNYVLRSPDGELIRSQGEAMDRARDYITHGLATQLEPL